jgi:hypothetical protein
MPVEGLWSTRHGAWEGHSMSGGGPEHVQEEDLKLFVLGRLTEGKSIAVGSHLLECEACSCRLGGAVEVARQLAGQHQRAHGQERRADPRFPANEVASMHTVNPLILDRLEVLVSNFSKNGLMLRTWEFVQVGIVVQIRLKARFVLGEVRYCMPFGGFFHVGIQVQHSHWHRGVNTPEDGAALKR